MKKKSKPVTAAQAKQLIKRELGINPNGLQSISGNPDFPIFEVALGNIVATVRNRTMFDEKFVELCVFFSQSGQWSYLFFFPDTLTLADEMTQFAKYDNAFDFCESHGISKETLNRMRRQAIAETQKHYKTV